MRYGLGLCFLRLIFLCLISSSLSKGDYTYAEKDVTSYKVQKSSC